MIIAVMLSDIVKVLPDRPHGWMAEMLSSASEVTDQHVAFPIAVYVALWEKHNPKAPLPAGVAKLWDRRPWWDRLHALVTPTPADLAELVDTLRPDRRVQWDLIVSRRPVRFDDFPAWAVEIHDDLTALITRPLEEGAAARTSKTGVRPV